MTKIFRTLTVLGLSSVLCSCYSLPSMVNEYEVIGHLKVMPSTDPNYDYQVWGLEHAKNSISEYSMVTREDREKVIKLLMPMRKRDCDTPIIVDEIRLKREERGVLGPEYAWLMNIRCQPNPSIKRDALKRAPYVKR